MAFGHMGLAVADGGKDLQPFQSKNGQLSLLHNGQIYNHQEIRSGLKAGYHFETNSDSEIILWLVEDRYDGDLTSAMKEILPMLDGVYTLTVTDNKQVVIARDKIGLKQLYYYSDDDQVAFAGEKKALMQLSGNGAQIFRLLPGHMATIDREGIHDFCFWTPESIRPAERIKDKKEALQTYGQVIVEAIRKRVAGRRQVGIIFSGGVDSLLVAYMVQKLGIPFTCYTAGRKGASDVEMARNIAKRFNFSLKIQILTLGEIEKLIPQIINTIEDHSLNQVEAAIALYVSARIAREAGEQVILTGQGADEIFGGYSWYPAIVDQEGYGSFARYSWEDTFLGYKETFERENKIATAFGLEMSVPYIDPDVIKVAFQISPELKIQRGKDQIQKRIHREYGISIGIPEEIGFRKKEAAQHGANVHDALEELASRTGVTESLLRDVSYDPNQSVVETLGSSSRYGFRYDDPSLWKPLAHVQYYLDSHAAGLKLLPPKSQIHWEETTRRLEAKGAIVKRCIK
jgi:asparagine synthase (glutamine-hydrolysing)